MEPSAGNLYNVYLDGLDHSAEIFDQNKHARAAEIPRVEVIVEGHVAELSNRFGRPPTAFGCWQNILVHIADYTSTRTSDFVGHLTIPPRSNTVKNAAPHLVKGQECGLAYNTLDSFYPRYLSMRIKDVCDPISVKHDAVASFERGVECGFCVHPFGQSPDQLSITEETVKGRVKNILSKLGANDRTHAATIGLKRGIIDF
jgi:hypothetical protein